MLFVHPYVIYPATLRFAPKRRLEVASTSHTDGTGFALFFCAYNEAKVMPEKLDNLRALRARYPGLAIYAYDDSSSDGTLELLQSDPGLVTVVRGGGRTGKAHGMKRMVALCREPFLVFTDANVMLDIECIAELERHYADQAVGGVCGTLCYVASDSATVIEMTGGLYWRLEEKTKGLESATGNVMGADGSIFSVRRELYPDFPDTVQDDFTVSMSVVFSGKRLVKGSTVLAYERLVTEAADEKRRKVRIAARAYHTNRVLRPGLVRMSPFDKYKYVSHKLLRWWGAVPLAFGAIAAIVFCVSIGLAGAGILAVSVAAVLIARATSIKLFTLAADLVTAVISTFRGVLKARRGETFAVWTPPVSR